MQIDLHINSFWKKYQPEAEVIAVGVSGGADSLALVLCLHDVLSVRKKRIVALSVDHKLREESRQEAEYVAQVMAKYGIEHHILTWEGDKPVSGIEEAAREARYRLLQNWCEDNGVNVLAVAHHAKDQAETFFLRLQRGSGLFGLCGMQPVSKLGRLTLIRPLLNCNPEELRCYLQEKNIQWVEDPSNQCEDYLRVKIRNRLPMWLEELNLPLNRLVETMRELSRARDYIQTRVDAFIKNNARFWESCAVSVNLQTLATQHDEIVFHVLAELIRRIGKNIYTPRADNVERLAARLFSHFSALNLQDNEVEKVFNGATLGQCEIFVQYGKLWIVPELKMLRKMPKKFWSDFCNQYPEYKKCRLPYKLRAVLVKTKMKVEF